jgi:hypothetical protein
MIDVLAEVAAWLVLAGFCWLLLLHYREQFERDSVRRFRSSRRPRPRSASAAGAF